MGNNTPMKVFSYLESGVPLLATKLSMHTQVLDNDIALLVEATPLDMARGMCSLLEDQDLRHQVSDAAKDRIQEKYAPEHLAMRLTEFYNELETTLGATNTT
jgi:glycosyltransferase involved in cell wall biosynthesis